MVRILLRIQVLGRGNDVWHVRAGIERVSRARQRTQIAGDDVQREARLESGDAVHAPAFEEPLGCPIVEPVKGRNIVRVADYETLPSVVTRRPVVIELLVIGLDAADETVAPVAAAAKPRVLEPRTI